MMVLQKIYYKSPVWVQNLMCSIQGHKICRRRYNKDFYVELERYERGFYHQAQELLLLLETVKQMEVYKPYLTNVDWSVLKSKPEGVYDVIACFPVIGKMQVKENIEAFSNPHFEGKKIIMQTSGTTGGGLVFPYSVEMENRQWAVWWRYRRALGITLDTWCGWFGGKTIMAHSADKAPFWRINNPGRQIMFSSYHLTRETVSLYYDKIKHFGLTWLHGYPSHLSRLASFIMEAGLAPLKDVKFVTTGAENVLGNQMVAIQSAFPNAIIRQHYGLNEGVANFSQNREGIWIEDKDFCYVEFVPISEASPNTCHIIGTGFSNLAFPLIRYDTGDLATVERDEQGHISKILSIDGRSGNVLRQPSGHVIVEASLSIVLHEFNNIVEAQFHQKSIQEIELWVVRGKDYSDDDEAHLLDALDRTFERGVNCHVKYVDQVERTKSGKLKLVVIDGSL